MANRVRVRIALALGVVLLAPIAVHALGDAKRVAFAPGAGSFPLAAGGHVAPVFLDERDYPGVLRAGQDFREDLRRVTGVAAGAAYGTVEYVNNALQVTQEVSLDRAWNAANAALKNLGLPVTATQKDGLAGRLEARNAQNQPVIIKLTRQTDTATKIEISVGTFDSAANRTEARLIYDRMKEKF